MNGWIGHACGDAPRLQCFDTASAICWTIFELSCGALGAGFRSFILFISSAVRSYSIQLFLFDIFVNIFSLQSNVLTWVRRISKFSNVYWTFIFDKSVRGCVFTIQLVCTPLVLITARQWSRFRPLKECHIYFVKLASMELSMCNPLSCVGLT